MTELCKNCGHPLPNAAGGGLYCNECGEPVHPSQTRRTAKNQNAVIIYCAWCGERLGHKPRAEVGKVVGAPDWPYAKKVNIIVHAEPCAVELLRHDWELA